MKYKIEIPIRITADKLKSKTSLNCLTVVMDGDDLNDAITKVERILSGGVK